MCRGARVCPGNMPCHKTGASSCSVLVPPLSWKPHSWKRLGGTKEPRVWAPSLLIGCWALSQPVLSSLGNNCPENRAKLCQHPQELRKTLARGSWSPSVPHFAGVHFSSSTSSLWSTPVLQKISTWSSSAATLCSPSAPASVGQLALDRMWYCHKKMGECGLLGWGGCGERQMQFIVIYGFRFIYGGRYRLSGDWRKVGLGGQASDHRGIP